MTDEKNKDRPAEDRGEERWPRVPPPSRWSEVMDELIEEAIRSGSFDDLPGRGKPLSMFNNPFTPGTELAYQLLKDNNYTLPWISQRQAILASIEDLRDDIGRVWRRFKPEFQAVQDEAVRMSLSLGWHEYLEHWQGQITEINRQITTINLKQPGDQLEIFKLSLDNELRRIGASRKLE